MDKAMELIVGAMMIAMMIGVTIMVWSVVIYMVIEVTP